MNEQMSDRAAQNVLTSNSSQLPQLIAQKLVTFERIADDVSTSFPFIEEVHGQRRFPRFPVDETVHYLHALWVCDCKDMLLSVPTTSGRRLKGSQGRYERHEGQRALEVLCDWQQGATAGVVRFLEFKLDYAPVYEITQSLEAATQLGAHLVARRLAHGRTVLLNRTHNLTRALAAIFALSPVRLRREVLAACARYGHTVEQCAAQLAEMREPLYACVRHPELARRNMVLMNSLGVGITDNQADRPGHRTPIVQRPTVPPHSYAEHVVTGETTMVDLGLAQR